MDTEPRPSGIEGLGDLSGGTHVCLFYETEQDLLEMLALFFKPGLASNEFCLWLTPDSSGGKARSALRQVIPSADQHLEEGNIEVISGQQWYWEEDKFDPARVAELFDNKLTQALEKGYTRMRVLGDKAWLDQERWKVFSDHEGTLDTRFAGRPVSILCAYPTASHSAADILDIARTHNYITAKRNGNWEILKAPELKHTKAESERVDTERSPQENEQKTHNSRQGLSQSVVFRYGVPILAVVLSLAGAFLLQPYVFRTPLFFLSIMVSTWIGGMGPGMLAVLLSMLALNVFLSPAGSLETRFQNIPTIISFLITALLVGSWSEARRRVDHALHAAREELEDKVQERTADLSQANQALQEEIIEHKRSEAALRTNEYRLQAAINAADIGFWDWDLASGKIVSLGHHDKLFGFAPGEFDGTYSSFEKRVHPMDLEELNRVVQLAREAGSEYAHEYHVVWPDGTIHWIAGRGRFEYNASGEPVRMRGAVLDISERKRAEEQVSILQSILMGASTAGDLSSTLQEVLRRVCERTGWVFGQAWLPRWDRSVLDCSASWFSDAGLEKFQAISRQIAFSPGQGLPGRVWSSKQPAWLENATLDPNFPRAEIAAELGLKAALALPMLTDGEVVGVIEFFLRQQRTEDEWLVNVIAAVATQLGLVIERKRAEEELRRAEELFRAIVEDQTEMIVRWKPDGTRTFVNKAYCHAFGKSYEELVGTSFWLLVAEPYREGELQRIRSLRPDLPYSTAIHESLLPDGNTQWQEWADRGFFDEQGRLVELQSVGRDITERKRAEQEDRQQAARREALAEISQALAKVGLDTQAVFDTIAHYTAEHIGDSCAIRLLSNDKQWLNLVAFHHPVSETATLLRPTYLTPMPANQEWFRQVLQLGQSLILPVISQQQIDSLLPAEFQLVAGQFRLHSGLIVPLRVEDQVIGTIALTRVNPQKPSYTPNDQVLLQELADRAGLTIQNARFFEQVEEARERLAALSRRLLEVQESERRSLTRELHDRVGQNLTGLSINLQNMKALLSGKAALTLAAKFDDAQGLVQDTTRQIRDIMAELHLPELEDYGLAAALETYAERAANRGNLELIADLPDLPPPHLRLDVRNAVFRASQEVINNVLKHADATRLEVRLEERDGRIHLRIEDNGQGFAADLVSQKEARTWGLQIMRERIESIGGRVQIESRPSQGTRVTFEIERPS